MAAIENSHHVAGARTHFAITANGVELAKIPDSVFVGVGGNIYWIGADDTASPVDPAPLLNVASGTILPIQPRYVLATTTATNLVGLIW